MLVFIAFLGLLISFIAHILLLFKINLPSNNLSIALSIGLVISFSARLFSTKNLRQEDNWFLDSSIKNICPYKLKVWTIIIVAYGVVIAVVNLIGMFSKLSPFMTEADYTIALRKLFIAVFSLLSSCYMFEVMLNLCFRILKKHQYNESQIHC